MKFHATSLVRALVIGTFVASAGVVWTSPLFDNAAYAKNGGNGGGKGGGNGGGNSGGNGNGNSGGNSSGNSGGNGSGNSGGNSSGNSGGPQGNPGDTASKAEDKVAAAGERAAQKQQKDSEDELSPNELGKLNGFMHAAPQALNNTSPNSAIGSVSQTFRDLLNRYVDQSAEPVEGEDPAPTDEVVDIDDLAAALAKAVNKPVTEETVNGVLGKLTQTFGDDYSSVTDPDPDTSGDEGEGDETATEDGETSFAEDLADRVNQIKGFE